KADISILLESGHFYFGLTVEKELFSHKKKGKGILSKIFKRKKNEEEESEADKEENRKIIKKYLTSKLEETSKEIKLEIDKLSEELKISYNFYEKEEGLDEKLQEINKATEAFHKLKHIIKIIDELSKEGNRFSLIKQQIKDKVFDFEKKIRRIFEKNLLNYFTNQTREIMKNSGLNNINQSPALTSDLLNIFEEVKAKIDSLIKKYSSKNHHIPIPNLEFNSYFKDALDIGEGNRILTHTGPTVKIYEVLKEGKLKSLAAQGESAERTHTSLSQGLDKEVNKGEYELHDICFELDRVYRNFNSSDTNKGYEAKIVLCFSEAELIAEKRYQYAESDGIHLFDPAYQENQNEIAANLDLRSSKMIILVSEDEKGKFKKFLASLSEDLKQKYEQSIVYVNEIKGDIMIDGEIRNKSITVENIKGFVIPTGQVEMKTVSSELRKFVMTCQ
ncbi:MAG: hypothetical protein ACOC1P_04320, partial [Minisyncoccales bacterium]